MKVSFYAGGLPHFLRHGLPIWDALPDDVKGTLYARGRASVLASRLNIPHVQRVPSRDDPLVMVASYEDYLATKKADIIFLNHGVGQTYNGDPSDKKAFNHPAYSGGNNRDRVKLFLCTSNRDAENCGVESNAMSVPVGVPYLDNVKRKKVRNDPPVVAVSFHADVHVCPETRWAFPEYKDELMRLANEGTFNLLGHAHPRMEHYMKTFWHRLRVPFESDWFKVLETADLYVCDNSSTMYEAAAVGLPVLTLNASYYRRDVEHGLRFWDAIPGHSVDTPDDLEGGIHAALMNLSEAQEYRKGAVQVAYDHYIDGKATNRAVTAILDLLSTHAT